MVIYKTTNLINGKVYVGQDSRNRPKYYGSGKYIRRAIKKYGKENFKKEIMAWCYTKKHLNFLEQLYIDTFNTKVPNGYNLTDGGEGTLGFKPSEETRKKLSDAGRNITEETRCKRSATLNGHEISEETKKKISKSLTGRKLSEEHKQKIGRKGENNPMFGKTFKHTDKWKKDASKRKKGRFTGSNHPMFGKSQSDESNKKRSDSLKNRVITWGWKISSTKMQKRILNDIANGNY